MAGIVGLITARGGSKGVPRKNIQVLAGKPLIAWTIEAALQSQELDRVIVSTDDREIASISRRFGAEVPFIRPLELALDASSHVDVILHAIDWLAENEQYDTKYITLLQPTSPLPNCRRYRWCDSICQRDKCEVSDRNDGSTKSPRLPT